MRGEENHYLKTLIIIRIKKFEACHYSFSHSKMYYSMKTKKIFNYILIRINIDQCVENIVFIVATNDCSNFRYKKSSLE